MLDNTEPGFLWDLFRTFFSLFDRVVYQLIVWIYEVFFAVARFEVFSTDTIVALSNRIFLILGIFMLFKLAFSLLNSIVNPDMLTDKEKGFGKIVSRVLIMIVLLLLLLPLDIPGAAEGSYEEKLNSHGFLFGTLYTLQDRVLETNVIGKIVLNTQDTANSVEQGENLQDSGNSVAAQVYKAFFYPNPECETVIQKAKWNSSGTPVQELISMINQPCGGSSKVYSYSYMPVISTIAGGILVFIILGFTVDIAIRAIKISVLRLIAPIPIVSYIDPKSSKDGAFAAWVKTLSSTYLDLFLRLIIIYFVIFAVSEITKNFPTIEEDNFIIKSLAYVFVIIGAFFFAKQAPKFFKDMLGIKGQGSGSLGLSGLLGGTAALIGGAGLAGAGAAALGNMNASIEAAKEGKSFNGGWAQGRDFAAQVRTGNSKARGGLFNHLQQSAALRANRNAARKLGLTQDTLDRAKSNMFDAQAQAAKAQDTYDRFNKGAMTDAEMNGLASQFGHFDTDSGQMVMNDAEMQHARTYLYNDAADKQSAAAKAESNYKKADKEWSSRGLDKSFVEDNSPQRFYRARKLGTSVYDKVNGQGAWDARSQQKASDRAARQSVQTDKVVDRSRERGGFDPNKR